MKLGDKIIAGAKRLGVKVLKGVAVAGAAAGALYLGTKQAERKADEVVGVKGGGRKTAEAVAKKAEITARNIVDARTTQTLQGKGKMRDATAMYYTAKTYGQNKMVDRKLNQEITGMKKDAGTYVAPPSKRDKLKAKGATLKQKVKDKKNMSSFRRKN